MALVEFDAGNGQTVLVEVEHVELGDIEPISRIPGQLAAKARQSLSEAIDGIAPMVRTMKSRLDTMTDPGDAVEVKFGVKLSGEIGAVIGKVGSEVNYEVTLKWMRK